jgi:MipA family protein
MWTVTVGGEVVSEPAWPGANDQEIRFRPYFNIRRAGTPERFSNGRESFGFAFFDQGNFAIGVAGALKHLNDDLPSTRQGIFGSDYAAELGGFVDYWVLPWLRGRVEVRQGIAGHHGVVADLMADAVFAVNPALTLSAGPRVTFASSAALSPFFSVDAFQSAVTGLPTFNARGGLNSVGAGAKARYRWTNEWATHVFVEYERLTGDAADSPYVVQRGSENQVTVGAGLTYSFDIPQFW